MRPGPTGPKPPRPPNAWILYRSDKLRELAERRDPHAPKRLQADISKEISEMWKSENPEIKREYERISEIKKQEHRTQYPNYKFQP
ncbi:high mobility group box domain-containing protein, partial [Fomitopsis betulina]